MSNEKKIQQRRNTPRAVLPPPTTGKMRVINSKDWRKVKKVEED